MVSDVARLLLALAVVSDVARRLLAFLALGEPDSRLRRAVSFRATAPASAIESCGARAPQALRNWISSGAGAADDGRLGLVLRERRELREVIIIPLVRKVKSVVPVREVFCVDWDPSAIAARALRPEGAAATGSLPTLLTTPI